MNFATPTRQLPRFAKPGYPGEEFNVTLELKLLADVGLVGFPNVGKSTFISVVSAAKPKIAKYNLTTITPELGDVKVGEKVRIISGPFAEFVGDITEVYPDKAKLRAMVSIFGRETPVELEYKQIQKL